MASKPPEQQAVTAEDDFPCGQVGCDAPAEFMYVWLSKEHFACAEHTGLAKHLAGHIGIGLSLIASVRPLTEQLKAAIRMERHRLRLAERLDALRIADWQRMPIETLLGVAMLTEIDYA